MDNQQRPTCIAHTCSSMYIYSSMYSTWNSAQCYVPAWMGGGFGEELIHVYVWLSHFAVHLKLPQHCQLVIPQYKMLLVLKKIKKTLSLHY